MVAIIAVVVGACVIVLTLAIYFGLKQDSSQKFELRKTYVEKCKLTPDQAEKLIPETP